MTHKFFMILMYLLLLIMIPIIMDYMLTLTIRKNRIEQIIKLSKILSDKTHKPILIFNDVNSGYILEDNTHIRGSITDILENIRDNSVILILNNVIEYVDYPDRIIEESNRISGGDLYIIGYEKNSLRLFFDYKIKRNLIEPYFLPNSEPKWTNLNDLQIKIQKFYSSLFKIIPIYSVMSGSNV